MLTTNEFGMISETIRPVAHEMMLEAISTILGGAVLALIGLWKHSAFKSKTQSAVAEVFIRALKKTGDRLGEDDTSFLTRTVHEEAQNAGIEKHVEKAVDKVATKMATEQNGNESARL